MFKRLRRIVENIADDLGYYSKRSGAFIVGKAGGEVGGLGMAALAGPLIGMITGFDGAGYIATIGTVLAAGVVAGVSGGLVQVDFKHRRGQLVDRYREEAAAALQKAPDRITEKDIELLARGDFKKGIAANPAIRQELKNSWLERNIGMVLSGVVAATTFLLIHALDPYLGGVHALAHSAGSESLIGAIASNAGNLTFMKDLVVGLGLNGLAGFATYHTLKTPLHMAASEILGIEENTVNDRITDIKRELGHGRSISAEEVLGVFIQAHQDVKEQMKADYGKEYDAMNAVEKSQILSMMQQHMDIKSIADDINKGRMRPEELAFTTFGQKSGIEKAEAGTHQQHGNVFDGMWRGLSAITGGFTSAARATTHREMTAHVGELPGRTTYSIHAPSANEASMQMQNEFESPNEKQSFTARIGRKVEENGLSHVERLTQSSNQELVLNR